MFGTQPKITDSNLYTLSDIAESRIERLENELKNSSSEDAEKKVKLAKEIEYFKTEIEKFKTEIENQIKQKPQFSKEELYTMYGQYDVHIYVEFHKYSDSAKKYGKNISGILRYLKSDREKLDTAISQSNVPRTADFIKINCKGDKGLNDSQLKDLLENGFQSSDIHQILEVNLPKFKSFNQQGIKVIPNTITVNFDASEFDPNKAFLGLYRQKIRSGEILIENEWAKFCGLSIFFNPESLNDDPIKMYAHNPDGSIKKLVRFYELEAKLNALTIDGKELFELEDLLKERREERILAIKTEINRSTNKKLENFEKDHPDVYKELEQSILDFKDESLEYYTTETSVYWDYEGYLHIYLRHCEELGIEGHFEGKTKFQYSPEDIKRILQIAIKQLKPKISAKLKEGKDYRLYGDQSLYFNGNYYSIHIQSNGRVASFHPLENPKQQN